MKTKVVLLLLTAMGMTYYWPQPPKNDPAKDLLHEVCKLVKDHHLHPRPINDELSKEMFRMYLSEIDPEKVFFTQKEVDQLSGFELLLDDELNNGTMDFYKKSLAMLARKIDQVAEYYPAMLSETLDLNQPELLETNPDKIAFATNEDFLRTRWRKRIKWQLLEELWGEEQKNKLTWAERYEAARKQTLRYFDKQFEQYRAITDQERLGQYVNAYLKIHDVQSEYLLPREKEEWDADFTRSLVGIGARIEIVNQYPQLLEVIVGGPAWKTKRLEEGDLILKIGEADQAPVDVFGMTLAKVLSLLRGTEDSELVLTVKKNDAQIEEIPVKREKVALDQAMAYVIDHRVGYLKLPRFYTGDHGCAMDVLQQLEQFNKQGTMGLIIDLRDNKGGSAQEVIKLLGYFIEEGLVMQSSYREGDSRQYMDEDPSVNFTGKILVMVNSRSSSGSELFAGTLQDYQRAVIVGSKATYGKGSIQRFFEIEPDNSGHPMGNVKLTTGRFYTAAGRSPQYSGISPDIILADATDGVPSGERVYPYALPGENLPFHQVSQSVCEVPKIAELREHSRTRQGKSARFKLIEKYAAGVKENWENTQVQLSFEAFKRAKMDNLEQKAQLDAFYQPIPGFEVQPMPEENLVKKHKAEQWCEHIQNDPYVQECYLIMREMVG